MGEMWVQSLGQEDLLEEEMATNSSILAWVKQALVIGVTKELNITYRLKNNYSNHCDEINKYSLFCNGITSHASYTDNIKLKCI